MSATRTSYQLITYETANGPRAGMVVSDIVYDISEATGSPQDASMIGVLQNWPASRSRLSVLATRSNALGKGVPLSDIKLLAPIPSPGTIYCAGANYTDHVEEMARRVNATPDPDPHTLGLKSWHFIKSANCVVGPDAEVAFPSGTKMLDWEAELVAVIGRNAKNVSQADALAYVAGFTIANDLSARDLTRRPGLADGSPFKFDWVAQKCFDGACPIGPWIVPAEDVADPQDLAIELTVNGVTKQRSNTGQMIFNIAEQISHLSERLTLQPGDLILTGTPAGVGAAIGQFLRPGDTVAITIEGLGRLVNKIV